MARHGRHYNYLTPFFVKKILFHGYSLFVSLYSQYMYRVSHSHSVILTYTYIPTTAMYSCIFILNNWIIKSIDRIGGATNCTYYTLAYESTFFVTISAYIKILREREKDTCTHTNTIHIFQEREK